MILEKTKEILLPIGSRNVSVSYDGVYTVVGYDTERRKGCQWFVIGEYDISFYDTNRVHGQHMVLLKLIEKGS